MPENENLPLQSPPQTSSTDVEFPTRDKVRLMGLTIIIFGVLFGYLLLVFWPAGLAENTKGNSWQDIYFWGEKAKIRVKLDVQLILLVMISGGIGSFIHTATSFGDYVGNRQITVSWLLWYVFRPFIGMAMAVIFYLVIRGGFLSAGTSAGSINPFGIAALAGLVGLFSKQASDKLNEVFSTLFRTAPEEGDAKRKDGLTNPRPILTDIEPKRIVAGTETLIIKIKGTGFIKESVVKVNGTNRETVFGSESTLTTTLLKTDLSEQGELSIVVSNPAPGGGESTPLKFVIDPAEI